MANNKLKMSNKRFAAIMIPILAIFLVLVIGVTVAMNLFSNNMNMFFGRGTQHIVALENTADWETDYYGAKPTIEASTEAGYKVAREVSDEGSVLLKNNGVLPLSTDANVMPFGRAYLDPVYGQVDFWGSGKWTTATKGYNTEPTDPVTPIKALSSFSVNDAAVKAMNAAGEPAPLAIAEGTSSDAGKFGGFIGSDSKIREYGAEIYYTLTKTNDTTGIVFITRSGEEGVDKKMDGYADGTPHYLALSVNEKETIKEAKRICGKVVVVLISSAPLELAPIIGSDKAYEADAVLWMGHPGERGLDSLAGILNGTVNPSGRTPDLYPTDFTKDPSYQNMGEFYYTSTSDEAYKVPYIEYQEDMYIGYRYYETAHDIGANGFSYGELDENGGITAAGAVCYPFGYGLSYTRFKQSITKFEAAGATIDITVTVENIGSKKGKDVVQLYYTAPYTQFDISNKIEKPTVNLLGFAKTEAIEAGEAFSVDFSFAKEDLASYCYTHDNGDGTKGCYVLESGDYTISLRKNSHTIYGSEKFNVPTTLWYYGENLRKTDRDAQSALDDEGNTLNYPADRSNKYFATVNQFDDITNYMLEESSILSRSDWNGTFPKRESRTKEVKQKYAAMFDASNNFDWKTDKLLGNIEGSKVFTSEMPVSGAKNGLVLSDLRGRDFYDDIWEELLDQLDWSADASDIRSLFTLSAYATAKVDSIGLMPTREYDGINGVKVPDGTTYDMSKSTTFGFMPLMAATWNVELLTKVGEAIANDALANGINGLYAPAVNLHRSLFNGRVFEYYSEDPVLSGKMAAAFIGGAGNRGMFCYIKHFAVNDAETNRDMQLHTWVTEQAMRELYLKAFEIPIKEARMTIRYIADTEGTVKTKTMRAATGVMAAQSDIGAYYGHCNYALLTTVLRDEWGFCGTVVSDYFDNVQSNRDMALRAGCDTYLSANVTSTIGDYDSATARSVMRQAIHRLAYTVVNSNAMQGVAPGSIVYYDMAMWAILLLIANIVIYGLIIGGIVWIVLRVRDDKKHPEKYKHNQKA